MYSSLEYLWYELFLKCILLSSAHEISFSSNVFFCSVPMTWAFSSNIFLSSAPWYEPFPQTYCSVDSNTVKPVYKDHSRDQKKAVFIDRWISLRIALLGPWKGNLYKQVVFIYRSLVVCRTGLTVFDFWLECSQWSNNIETNSFPCKAHPTPVLKLVHEKLSAALIFYPIIHQHFHSALMPNPHQMQY